MSTKTQNMHLELQYNLTVLLTICSLFLATGANKNFISKKKIPVTVNSKSREHASKEKPLTSFASLQSCLIGRQWWQGGRLSVTDLAEAELNAAK